MVASLGNREPQWVPQSLSQDPLNRVASPEFSSSFVLITGLVKGDGSKRPARGTFQLLVSFHTSYHLGARQ